MYVQRLVHGLFTYRIAMKLVIHGRLEVDEVSKHYGLYHPEKEK